VQADNPRTLPGDVKVNPFALLLGRFAAHKLQLAKPGIFMAPLIPALQRIQHQLCASNCPYGNIFMVPNRGRSIEVPDFDDPGESRMVAQLKAATCDLCDAEGDRSAPKPQCVASCPHEAASRVTGPELLQLVTNRSGRAGESNLL